jgi:heme/copper-type cytochrome/quinol oxidase subunit 4
MVLTEHQTSELRKKNLRLLWLLLGFALMVMLTSFPFWIGIFRIVGDQAAG